MHKVVRMILVEGKYLTWAVRIVLLLAMIVSAFRIPLAITFLLAAAYFFDGLSSSYPVKADKKRPRQSSTLRGQMQTNGPSPRYS